MTEDDFFGICPRPIIEGFRQAIAAGFSDYAKTYSNVADIHDSRTVANLIHCHIVQRVKNDVCSEQVIFRFAGQRNLFVVKDSFLVLFKKLDENLQSHNYPTPAALSFNAQEELEGIPVNLPRVEMGYVTDVSGAVINGIYAVRRLGKKIDWSVDLYDIDGPSQPDIVKIAQ